jgi:hypothetical protein
MQTSERIGFAGTTLVRRRIAVRAEIERLRPETARAAEGIWKKARVH